MLYALIMAGGSGTRLWPRSRTFHPKQFLDLTENASMLQVAQERLAPLVPPERVLVATGRQYVDTVARQLPSMPRANILGEPAGRGTAAAIGLAAVALRHRDPEAVMAVVTADHLIARVDVFRQALAAAEQVARDGWLVTLGIQPTYPETGYGYIERGEQLPPVRGFEIDRVARFVEKPERATAERFVQSGRYAWNSGMFIWTVEAILAEMARHMPALYAALIEIERHLDTSDAETVLARVWSGIENQTIDYGVMEKAERVAVLPVDIGWNDIGSWAAVYDVLPHDEANNAVVGLHISPDTRNSLVFSPARLVATIGLDDMIVVDTDDAVLICPRSRAQDVKLIVSALQERGLMGYLRGRPPVETQPLSAGDVGRLFDAATPVEAALLSLLFHAGLTSEAIAGLSAADLDLSAGWVSLADGRRILPRRTVETLIGWAPARAGGSVRLFPDWDANEVERALWAVGERAAVPVTVARAHETLAHALFDVTEEGHVIRSVLGDDVTLARLPLHALFPFSLGSFTGFESSDLAQRGRRALDAAADLL